MIIALVLENQQLGFLSTSFSYDHSECERHSCRMASRPAEPCLTADSTGELMSYLQIPLGLFWTDGNCNMMQFILRVWERIAVGILSACYL